MMNNLSSMFMNLPGPFKVGFLLLGAGSVAGGAILLGNSFGLGYYIFYIILIVGIVAALAIFLYKTFKKWNAKKKGLSLSQDVGGNAAAAPRDVSDPNQLADIDRVRGDFDKGMERLKSAGRNVYSEPWYLMVGEPGGGKTEALRHSRLDFVPGFQDRLQGAGGTLGMHWWFTTSGIILDTAGRLMFDATPEWDELLRILRKHRPFKPVNGLILVIPAKSLIRDDDREFEDKGRRIAEGLQYIKTKLDVCFPVYVVVTMCDLIPGFTEFFGDLHDPELQDQILGWSNPDPAGEGQSLNPEDAGKYIAQVRDRLAARRLAKILHSQQSGDAYADSSEAKVEDLYAFPDGLQRLAPRLQRYLEMAFAAGGWGKPLFLRGIYFTSAMTEGATLDEALAEVLNVPVKELPEDTRVARDKSYFLRHVFLKKMFMEQGLVSPATDVRRIRRKRRIAFATVSGIAAVILLAFMIYASSSLKNTVADPQQFWSKLNEPIENSGRTNVDSLLKMRIVRSNGSGGYVYQGNEQAISGWKDSPTLEEFFQVKAEPALQSAKANWIFKPAAWATGNFSADITGSKRRELYRRLFEVTTLQPIVDETVKKLKTEDEFDEAAVGAMEQLLRLYATVAHPEASTIGAGSNDANGTLHVQLQPMLDYLLDATNKESGSEFDSTSAENLQASLESVYESTDDYAGGWPPKSFSEEQLRADLRPAVEALGAYWVRQLSVEGGELARIKALYDAFLAYDNDEQRLLELPALTAGTDYADAPAQQWSTRFRAFASSRSAVDSVLENLSLGSQSLEAYVAAKVDELRGSARSTFNRLISAAGGDAATVSAAQIPQVEPVNAGGESSADGDAPAAASTGLVASLVHERDRLAEKKPFDSGTPSSFDFSDLDKRFLAKAGSNTLFAWRYALYNTINDRMAEDEEQNPGLGEFADWISGINQRLQPIRDAQDDLRESSDGKPLEDDAQQLATWSMDVIGKTRIRDAGRRLLNQLASLDNAGLRRTIGEIDVPGDAGTMSANLALVGEVSIPSEFIPARAAKALEGWSQLDRKMQDRKESAEFLSAQRLMQSFEDEFEQYWVSGLADDISVNVPDSRGSGWEAFVDRIQVDESRRFREDLINDTLQEVAGWRRIALQSMSTPQPDLQRLVDFDARIFGEDIYNHARRTIVSFYKDETIRDREAALRKFNTLLPDDRKDIVRPTDLRIAEPEDRSNSVVLAYWDSLNATAARLLQQAGAEQARQVHQQLAEFKVFPFASDAGRALQRSDWDQHVSALASLVERASGDDENESTVSSRRSEIGPVGADWIKATNALRDALSSADRELITRLDDLAKVLSKEPPVFDLFLWNKSRGSGHIRGLHAMVQANSGQDRVDMTYEFDKALATLNAADSSLTLSFSDKDKPGQQIPVRISADWLPLRLLLSEDRIGLVTDATQWRVDAIEGPEWLGAESGWGVSFEIREPGADVPAWFFDLRLKPESDALNQQMLKNWPKSSDWSDN